MRIYRLEYKETIHVLEGTPDSNGYVYAPKVVDRVEWFTSERGAAIRRLELFKLGKLVGKKRDAKVWGEEIDTRKAGLVAWLNSEEKYHE